MFSRGRCALLLFACSAGALGQSTVPAKMIVTIGHFYGQEFPVLTASDFTVTQDYAPLKITGLTPLRNDVSAVELFVLVDNCSNCEAGSQFEELTRFIATQPPTTSVGVAYIQNGQLQVAVDPTVDRTRVIKALSPPGGSTPSSPYYALADLIRGWKEDSSRRAVLMISTGLDPASTDITSRSKSAETAIEAAQRAEVTVYAIYHPTAGYLTTDFSKILAGQDELAHVAADSGGEAYFLNPGPMLSLAPFLADINQHLANQYLLEFIAQRGHSVNGLEEVQVKSKVVPDSELMVPSKAAVDENSTGTPRKKRSPES